MEQTTDTSLTLSRVFKATPEELWDIWTDPEKVNQWHRPNTSEYTTEAEVDAKVGGKYSISMKMPESTFKVHGVFTELDPPRKMVYTWEWEDDSEHSQVTVEFKPVDDGTELVLRHAKLSGPESVTAHKAGWIGCFDNIAELIKK